MNHLRNLVNKAIEVASTDFHLVETNLVIDLYAITDNFELSISET